MERLQEFADRFGDIAFIALGLLVAGLVVWLIL